MLPVLDAVWPIANVPRDVPGGDPKCQLLLFTDVLKAVWLTGAAFFDIVACAPWGAEQPMREMVLPKILPDAAT
jgi:hypothetical protein